jgi:anti-anti-sigma regulatory factor
MPVFGHEHVDTAEIAIEKTTIIQGLRCVYALVRILLTGIGGDRWFRETAMMKVQKQEDNGQLILQVEGRLAGAYVPELEACWRSERENDPGRAIAVDLKSVTCVDRAGKYLLLLMHNSGVRFVRVGMAVQDIVEQISEQTESRA